MSNDKSIFEEIEDMQNTITLVSDDGEKETFFVLEETTLNGENYLLVTDSEDEDGECYLLKDTSGPNDPEACYEFVEEDGELDYIGKIFSQLMSELGVDIE